jgi:hypothetical protein
MSRTALATALLAACLFAGSAMAETVTFHATMDGAAEVPANTTKGSGVATVMLDTATHKITYTVTYSGLTGPATMAHIHGPAEPGKNAGVVVPFKDPASPIKGEATLTDAQQADMMAGKYYVNVHTAEHKGGEIRGQLTK